MHYIMQIKYFWMAISRFHRLQPRGNNQHKEGLYATIISYIACQSFGSLCWTLEAIIFAAYMFRKNVLINNRSDLDDAILDENDNSSGRYCCSRRVLIARR